MEEDYQKIVRDIIKDSFSELENHKFFIFQRKLRKYFAFVSYFFFFSIIVVNSKLDKKNKDILVGILAHELSHISRIRQRSFLGKLWFGLKYLLSRKYKREEERSVDKLAIDKGYSKELLKARKFINKHRKYRRMNSLYLSPKEIKDYIK